jgi:hypothetical protein
MCVGSFEIFAPADVGIALTRALTLLWGLLCLALGVCC